MEEWKWIPGYEGKYSVSDAGRVFSCVTGRVLKPGKMSGGHLSVALGRNNTRCVHELVLTAFRGERPKGYDGRHLNGVHTDNRLDNLEWATRSRNIQDKKWHAGSGNYKLSVDDVRKIKTGLAEGMTQSGLARMFGVCLTTVHNIAHGRVHKDV